jgi:UDP-glucose:(heptosyl)LPS alpha-1,3-glucosyltransferase
VRVAYVYRDFSDRSSLAALFVHRAESLAQRADVTVYTAAGGRAPSAAPLSFRTVESRLRGRGRLTYAVECASFAWAATRALAADRERFDVVTVDGYAAARADVVVVHAVRPAEVAEYFSTVEPDARLRRVLAPVIRPQTGVVEIVERLLFRQPVPLCLVPSRRIAGDLTHHYGVPEDLIEIVPYGLDVRRFAFDASARSRERARGHVGEEELVLLFVGDEFGRKGLARALEAAAATPRAVLWVAGGGEQESYRARAAELGVAGRVRWLGRVPPAGLPALYSAADVLLLPSSQDAWGLTVIEAMAASCPVVVSSRAGAHEVVESGHTGFVLDGVGSGAEIASLLAGPLGDPTARRELGARAAAAVAAFDDAAVDDAFYRAHVRAAELRAARRRAVA